MSTPQPDKTAAARVTSEATGDSSGLFGKNAARTRVVARGTAGEDRGVEHRGAAHAAESSDGIHTGTERAAFGEFLRRARQQRGITLQQICNETKIPRAHLEALEEGNLALVPTGTYRRGEVVAYAAVVGLDRSVALAHLQSALQPSGGPQPSGRNDAPARVNRGRTRLGPGLRTIAGVGLGAAAMIVAASLWTVASVNPQPQPEPLTDALPPRAERQPDVQEVSAPPVTRVAREHVATPNAPERATPNASERLSNTRTSTAVAATPTKSQTVGSSPGRDGRLVIITSPAGARVTINGVGWGVTPLTIDNLPPGAKRIRVTSEGFSAAERTVNLPTVGAATVRIPLQVRAASASSSPPD